LKQVLYWSSFTFAWKHPQQTYKMSPMLQIVQHTRGQISCDFICNTVICNTVICNTVIICNTVYLMWVFMMRHCRKFETYRIIDSVRMQVFWCLNVKSELNQINSTVLIKSFHSILTFMIGQSINFLIICFSVRNFLA